MDDYKKSSESRDRKEKETEICFDVIFNDKKVSKEEDKMLKELIGRKIKVWVVLNDTIGGIKGRVTGNVGVLTKVDDEFILLDGETLLSRKFILRIELL